MSAYEAEIKQLRIEMEGLEIKINEDELQNYQKNPSNFSDQKMAREIVHRLTDEEHKLRNDFQLGTCPSTDGSDCNEAITKEKMMLMQQKKISALDHANKRLLEELNKISLTI